MVPNKIVLAICYVVYNPSRYGDNFGRLQRYLAAVSSKNKYFLIIDNENEQLKFDQLDRNIYKIRGDNTFREFSGWQAGVNAIRELKIPADVILFANNAFLLPRGSFLKYYNASSLIKQAFETNVMIGKIDRCGKNLTVYGYDVSKWICTNCFFLPRRALEQVPDLVSIKENINDFFDIEYSPNHLILDQELTASDLRDGDFRLEAALAGNGPKEIRLVIDRADLGAKLDGGRHGPIRIKELSLSGQGLERAELLRGWQNDRQGHWWIAGTGVVAFPPGDVKVLRVEGHIPPSVFEKIYHSRLRLKIYNDAALFKDQAPLNRNYRLHLVEWLTERWHSRFEINHQTWDLFKNKVAAILNEALLSARFIEAGFDIRPFGKLDPLLRVFARFWKI
jgi:hypothetical protein